MTKSFKELYLEKKNLPTPAQAFLEDVALATNRSITTVRMWISGAQIPDNKTLKILANKFDIEPHLLFPSNENK